MRGRSQATAIQLGVSNSGSVLPTFGQILVSTNKPPTLWSYLTSLPLQVPPNSGSTPCPPILPGTPMNVSSAPVSLCPVPGLAAIAGDPSGRLLFAVGAPAELLSIAGNPGLAPFTPATGAGVILFSANAGASFVLQQAPLSAGRYYTLNAVVVPRGYLAVAGGGSPVYLDIPTAASNASSGVLITTLTQGLSWRLATLPPNGVGALNGLSFYTYNASSLRVFAAMDTGIGILTISLPSSAAMHRSWSLTWPAPTFSLASMPSSYRPRMPVPSYSAALSPGRGSQAASSSLATGTGIYGIVW